MTLLSRVMQFKAEYDALFYDNDWFSSVDFEMYYGLVRVLRPRFIFEIGAGHSTHVAAAALRANGRGSLAAIDPAPRIPLPDEITHFPAKVETIPELDLSAGDILFIDSSHIWKPGNDVDYLYGQLLPRIKPGVVVHIHDVFLPDDYPPSWQDRLFTEHEQVADLLASGAWEILWSAHAMHLGSPDLLTEAFGSYAGEGIGPSSLWLQRRTSPKGDHR